MSQTVGMVKFTRGFSSRSHDRDPRLPPGQYDTGGTWPVLTAEATPRIDPSTWTFRVEGETDQPTTWTWDQMHALQAKIRTSANWSYDEAKKGVGYLGTQIQYLGQQMQNFGGSSVKNGTN